MKRDVPCFPGSPALRRVRRRVVVLLDEMERPKEMNRRSFLKWTVGAGAVAAAGARHVLAESTPLFTFAVVADPHLREDDRQCECTGVENFAKVVRKIKALPKDRSPDFMLICGDLHVEKMQEALADLTIPAHVVAGNHESRKHRAQLREMFPGDFQGKDFYSFRHKDCKFIGLCDAIRGDHVGHMSSEDITPKVGQCEWLERELADGDSRHTFLFGHIPPHPEGKDLNMYLGRNDSRYMLDIVGKRRPTALFFGHQHRSLTFDIGRSKCFVVPSSNWNMGFRVPIGFLHVKVLPDRIDTDFIETGPADTERYKVYLENYQKTRKR